jgi:hypothetical protein
MDHCATSSVVCRSPISAFSATLSVVALRFKRSDPNPERSAARTRWGGNASSEAVEAFMDGAMIRAARHRRRRQGSPAPSHAGLDTGERSGVA